MTACAPLGQLYYVQNALDAVSWPPAIELRNELRTWLRPRVMLSWATRRIVESVRGLPASGDANVQGNRDRWVSFVGDELGPAVPRITKGATDVRQRRAALGKVHSAISGIQKGNQVRAWPPSIELEIGWPRPTCTTGPTSRRPRTSPPSRPGWRTTSSVPARWSATARPPTSRPARSSGSV